MDALTISDYSFSYPATTQPVLCDISWSVPVGSFTLLVGSTGSGKTTLLRSLKPELTLEGICTGTLELFGQKSKSLTVLESATLVGYVAQSPENQIVCDTVWHEMAFGLENLATPPDVMRRRVAETAYFFGIESWFRRETCELSGGQKQLLNLASVLAMQPKLLVLDEPTAQLDPVASKNFLHALFRINRELGITVIVATHAPETMEDYATAMVRIDRGSLTVQNDSMLSKFAPSSDSNEGSCVGDRIAWPPRDSVSPNDATVTGLTGSDVAPQGREPLILLKDVCYRYARDAPWVLRDANLTVERGCIHALVGGNGCGKSTLLQMVAHIIKPERGRVGNAAKSHQALLPQNPKTLFVCDTVEEELLEWSGLFGYSKEAVCEVTERFGLAPLMQHHPYDTSGGQQQKIAFSKIILMQPDLFLLDEPTKGLDDDSRFVIAEELLALRASGKTILMVTHDLTFVSCVADTVSMIFDGEIACTEPVVEFFDTNLFYKPQEDTFSQQWGAR